MGAYLSAPVLHKALQSGETRSLCYGSAAQQGWRLSMEDESVACLDVDGDGGGHTALFAVFDGHGGCEARRPRVSRRRRAAGRAPRRAAAPESSALTRGGATRR